VTPELFKNILRRFPFLNNSLRIARNSYRRARKDLRVVKLEVSRRSKRELSRFLSSNSRLQFHPESPVVSIVVVLFNRAELTYQCLKSLLSLKFDIPFEIICVDNASNDETARLFSRVDGVRYVRSDSNRHFLAGTNQAAGLATGEFLLLLNNDTELEPDALIKAVQILRARADVGAVGAKLVLPNGQLQEAGSIVWRDATCLGYGRGDRPDRAIYNFERVVDYCSGAFLLTRTALYRELGGLDSAYAPAYYEDTDLCLRMRQRGFKIVYDPRIQVTHYEFASSQSAENAMQLQTEHREILVKKHRAELSRHLPSATENVLPARSAPHDQKRILLLDAKLPHVHTGAGFPRANAMLRALFELDYLVTVYPVGGVDPSETWESVYTDIPRNVECMVFGDYGIEGLGQFLNERKGYYSGVIISRPTTMNVLRAFLDKDEKLFGDIPVIYDAEALFVAREQRFAALSGRPFTDEEFLQKIGEELMLARGMKHIFAVSPSEAKIFRDAGFPKVHILSHCVEVRKPAATFKDRAGLLFVGAILDDSDPNGDSVWWFIEQVLPILRRRGFADEIYIVGTNHSKRLLNLSIPGVSMIGRVEDVTPWYDRARVFFAPTRFSAGIPLKVVEAVANGIPSVVTPLLATQLQWISGTELLTAETPEKFATVLLGLYQSEPLWNRLQQHAFRRVTQEYSMAAMVQSIASALKSDSEKAFRSEVRA